jgi:diguanylate cyclase (GGDEF)-like protein
MSRQPIRVLIVEDNPADARLIREHLSGARVTGTLAPAFQWVLADRLAAGLARLAEGGIDAVLLDLSLPDSQGLDTFVKAQAQAPDVPMVVLTGLDDEAVALQAMQAGAQDYLVKGQIDRSLLGRAIRYAVERHRLQADLRAMSLTDPLTGLYNRRGFYALAEQQLRMAGRTGRSLLLFFADMDGLKRINDTAGHVEGDRALQAVAEVLQRTFRASDIVARLGGDEFAILAIDAPENTAEMLTARLWESLKMHNAQGDLPDTLSLSLGLARFDPERPCSLDDLVTRADALMYAHKQRKRVPSPPEANDAAPG